MTIQDSVSSEKDRINALKSYNILDTLEEVDFDELTQLASAICQIPVALISLVDEKRQWFKSHIGIDVRETPIEQSFCAHAITSPADIMIVEDANNDNRFCRKPTCNRRSKYSFYAGVPLINQDGFALGTLCVVDDKKHELSDEQKKSLKIIAKQIIGKMELRRANNLLQQKENDLHQLNDEYQSLNDELNATNDNLNSLNEELAATNEEFAATNEELYTLNEEATFANNELNASKQQLAQAESIMRLAIEAANFGTWNIDVKTREFIASPRLKELFGFYPDEQISLADCIAQITEDYRDYVTQEVERAITSGGDYDLSYTVQGFHDEKIRWLHAIGNLSVDDAGSLVSFSGVIMDITEQKEIEQRKNDFIGIVSHELKTPLTSMSGYLQMLEKIALKDEDAARIKTILKARNQVGKMTKMINSFLDVTRLEAGKIHIDHQQFNMADLVREAEEEVIATISSHPIIFAPVVKTIVNADRDKIGQVITNLINNAVKYSPAGTTINIACLTVDNTAQVSIRDEGMGINPEYINKLFDRFYRVENKQVEKISGFGIGLYLCAEIIRRHEGKIWVKSKPDEGSIFYFSIPLL